MGLIFHVFFIHRTAEVADLHPGSSECSEGEDSMHTNEKCNTFFFFFFVVLSLDCTYVVIKVTAIIIIITKPSFRALFFFDISPQLFLSQSPTLSHASGFVVYADVWDKGPSNSQRFVFCLSSPHHSLMTLTDMALTVFNFFSSTPPISCCTKSCETKTHQSHHYTIFIRTELPFSSISLFKCSKSFCGWIPSHYFSFLVNHC